MMFSAGIPWRPRAALLAAAATLGLGAAGVMAPVARAQGLPLASLTSDAGNLVSPVTGGTNPLDPIDSGAGSLAGLGLSALGSWVLDGAKAALQETARVIDRTTAPRLQSTWFSSTYWRVAGLGALLTLPFLFAAAIQALLRSDLTLVLRAGFGYLPLALIGVSLAAPLAMLLLAATDEMCSVVARAGEGGGVHFLQQTGIAMVGLTGLSGSPFLAFAIGLFTLGAALALAVEMLVREAAVYVVLLMLPLAFAGLVWPARRVWAIRLVELLVALILSKFPIVAVLSLAGAAYGSSGSPSVTRLLMAMALLMLSTFAPWAMLRLLPFTELAAGAAGALRAELPSLPRPRDLTPVADGAAARVEALAARLRHQHDGPEDSGLAGGLSGGALAGAADAIRSPGYESPSDLTVANGSTEAQGGVGTGASVQADGDVQPDGSQERLPGMAPIWQAQDFEWPEFVLGPGGWGGPTAYVPPAGEGPIAPPAAPDADMSPPGADRGLPLPDTDDEGLL
jgi:hypothetical protein